MEYKYHPAKQVSDALKVLKIAHSVNRKTGFIRIKLTPENQRALNKAAPVSRRRTPHHSEGLANFAEYVSAPSGHGLKVVINNIPSEAMVRKYPEAVVRRKAVAHILKGSPHGELHLSFEPMSRRRANV